MASKRRTPEQIIAKLREAEVGLAQGRPESPNDSFGVTFGFRANVRGIISAEPPCDLLLDLVRQVSEVGLQEGSEHSMLRGYWERLGSS